ncbi:MAG: hypothetical protein IPJ31_14565 [Bacteroidetes bacterium]|nr:hypothetical protein [Bacteroidota bacterium]
MKFPHDYSVSKSTAESILLDGRIPNKAYKGAYEFLIEFGQQTIAALHAALGNVKWLPDSLYV